MKGTSAARSRSLIILRTSSSSVMTKSLKDLIPCRSPSGTWTSASRLFRRFDTNNVVDKQANLRRSCRVVKRHVVTGRDPTADREQESHVDSPHSDSTRTDGSIHPGIAMLIDILAREALRMVIAEQLGLPVRDSMTEKAARSVNATNRQS